MLPRKRDTSQSDTKGPFSGPALTMYFNVEGLSAAKEQLIADLRQRLQCAVVCVQETHRGPDAIRPSIPGMDLAIERPHSQYGSALFVTSGTIVNTTSLTDINNIEILRVDLNGISVTSAYKPPGERFSFHQPLTGVGDQQQVIIGDFNSHSSTWGYATTNIDGELVEDWADREPKIEPDSRPQASQLFQQRSMAARVQPRHHLCYQPNCRVLQQDCDGTSTTLPTSTHCSASECSYHCAKRTGSRTHISSMHPWRTSPPQPNAMTSS